MTRINTSTQHLLDFITQKLDAGKAENITLLDIRKISTLADFMIIATGTSTRHVMSLAHHLVQDLKKEKHPLFTDTTPGDGNWVALDLGHVLVHLFTADSRLKYDLEGLWNIKPKRTRKAPRKSA